MKTTLPILAAFFCCWLSPLAAANAADCPDNSCFNTEIINQETQGSCTTYTLEVGHTGDCQYALSHFSIEVPCGEIAEVSNSGGWAMEVGTTDPTTGITGIKIDDIKKFGEKDQPESFTVTYTVCNTGSCSPEELVPGKVAYKASTCVHYQDLEPPYTPMSGSLSATNLLCAGDGTGAIDLELNGGEAPFQFNWSTGATTEDLSQLSAGIYTLTVTDARGETLNLEATVNEPAALSLNAEVTHLACNTNGSIQPNVSGGTAPYSYQWSNGATAASLELTTAGTYSLVLTDANGCSLTRSYEVEDHNMLLSIAGGESCESNELQAVVTGGTAPYTYAWSSGETTASITPVETGTYTLTVSDAAGCTLSSSIDFTLLPALEASLSSTDPTCAYGTDGSIDLTVTSGSGSYTYLWSNGATTEDLSELKAGTYTVTITDASGCSIERSITVNNPRPIFVRQLELIQPDCHGNLGSISVGAAYGTEPYTFEWSNGQTGSSISGLEPGTYTVTITDANGCTRTRNFNIQEPSLPQLSISGGSCGGTLSASTSGGTAPYTYEWSTGDSTATIDYTAGGTYTVTVTDTNGCTSTETITVGNPAPAISLEYTVTQPLCYGDTNGSIDLTLTGGTAPYTYTWSNGETTEDLDGLGTGTYTVTVTDSSGCTATASISIQAPRAIYIRTLETVNVNCLGDEGSITVEAMYGTAPYTYEWSNGDTTTTADSLSAGTYTVIVTDANGCTSQRRFSISEETGPAVAVSSSGCGDTYELTANVTGGTAPYTYEWTNGEASSSISAGPGSYTVTVTDASGCRQSAEFTLEESPSPVSLQASLTHVSCAGGSNGSANVVVLGGVAPYTFDWSNGSSSETATGLSAGMYSVQVTDANGCSEVLAFTITEPQSLNLTAVVENNQSCGNTANGSIEVTVQGGTAPYTYEWNTGQSTASLSGLAAGNYTLTVVDASECVSIRSFTVEEEKSGTAPVALMEACADTVVCRGSTASLPVYFEGEGPFTLTYSVNGTQQSITTTANPYLLEVSPESKTTYALLSVGNSCGEGAASGQATIQVSDCDKVTVCEESCFSTQLVSSTTDGSCQTLTLQVSSDGDCRYALSHFNIAVSCGTVSNVSNSGNWPMEVNAYDPTTGLYGIKIDEIKNFGENNEPQSFTVTYTLCSEEGSCIEANSSCGPLVAYKAGSCVTYDKAGSEVQEPILPGGGWGEVSRVAATDFSIYPNPYLKNQELNISLQNVTKEQNAVLLITNMIGAEVYKGKHLVSAEQNIIGLQLSQVPPGTYLVSLQIDGRVITKQLYIL